MRLKFILIALTCTLFLIGIQTVSAGIYKGLSYQGRILDASGDPVADGDYDVTFTIWNHPTDDTESNKLWTSGPVTVSVHNGLFDYVIGSTFKLPDDLFVSSKCYLGIQVGSDAEIFPRMLVTASGYAFYADLADSLKNDIYLNSDGDTLTGTLYFGVPGGNAGNLSVTDDYANLFLKTDGEAKARIYGQDYGSMYLNDDEGITTVMLDATSSDGGKLTLTDGEGNLTVKVYAGEESDISVVLPDSAINSEEILDEPGIASEFSIAGVALGSTDYLDIETVTISIPAPGFIFLTGHCYVRTTQDSCRHLGAYLQIDETEGGSTVSSVGTRFSYSNNYSSDTVRTSISVDRVYFKSSAGSYTFRLEGKKYNGSTLNSVTAYSPKLTALYIPTSYDVVKTAVSDPGDNPEAVAVEILDEEGNPTGEIEYEVDLRKLELKAKQKRIEALEAELELKKARERIENE